MAIPWIIFSDNVIYAKILLHQSSILCQVLATLGGQVMKRCFLDSKVFELLVRPQYEFSCNISSITSCYNYLFDTSIRHDKVAKILGLNISGPLNPGNRTIRNWMGGLAKQFGHKVNVKIHFEGGWELDGGRNTKNWNILRKQILNPKCYCIIHIESHYAPILGFAAYSNSPTQPIGDSNRWIFIADPSPDHRQSRKRSQHWDISPPIWSIRWGEIRSQLTKNSNYGIISFTHS